MFLEEITILYNIYNVFFSSTFKKQGLPLLFFIYRKKKKKIGENFGKILREKLSRIAVLEKFCESFSRESFSD